MPVKQIKVEINLAQKSNGRGARRRVLQNKSPNRMVAVRPPQFQSTFTVNKRLRFQATAASGSVITAQNFNQILLVRITSTTARSIIGAVRLLRTEVWGPMSSSLAPVTTSIQYPSSGAVVTSPNRIYADTSMGTLGSYVSARPEKGSLASFWIPGGGNTSPVLATGYPTGAIIDVQLKIVIADGQGNDTSTITVPAGSIGDVLIWNLDGTTGNLTPVAYL